MTNIVAIAQFESFAVEMEAAEGIARAERSTEDNTRIRELNRQNLADDKKRQRYYSYATRALDDMVSTLSSMAEGGGQYGGRNNTLFRFGAKAGNYVAAGMISESECESALRRAAAGAGLSTQEIDTTLSHAIATGRQSPIDTDELDRKWQQKLDAWKAARQASSANVIDIAELSNRNAEYAAQRAQVAHDAATEYLDIADYLASDEGQDEQLRAAHAAFLKGIYRSWWSDTDNIEKPQKKLSKLRAILNEMQGVSNHVNIPQGQLSAILNLNDHRGATGFVLGRMHTAFITGRLSSAVFSIPMVADAINQDVRMVTNAFVELIKGGYIQFLRTSSIYNILSPLYKNTVSSESGSTPYLNQTPARLYTINHNRAALNETMLHQITVKKTEEYHKRSNAKTSEQMATDMGLSHSEYTAMITVDMLANKDKLSKQARAELNTELYGDAKGKWRGWEYALESDFALPIDWQTCESIKDVRGAILREWVKFNTGKRVYVNGETRKAQNSRTQLCRILGCSDATLQSIMDTYDVASSRQNRERKILNPDFRDLRDVTRRIMQDESAKIWMVRFKLKAVGEEKPIWQPTNPEYAALFYAENRANIEEIYIRYIAPSILTLKSVASWAQKWQWFLVAVAYWMICKHATLLQEFEQNPAVHAEDMQAVEITPMQSVKAESKAKTLKTETIEAQHVYTEHRAAFIQEQLAVKVFMYTPYKLVGDLILEDGELPARAVYQAIGTTEQRRRGIAQFIIENAGKKLVRKSADFFGVEVEDYEEQTSAALKAQRESEVKALYDSLVPDFDMPIALETVRAIETVAENKVIQMPLDNTKPKAVSPSPSEREQQFIAFCNTRMERESGFKAGGVMTLPAKPPVTESWVDASGILYEVCGDDIYVDGVKQYMTSDLWNYISRKKSA